MLWLGLYFPRLPLEVVQRQAADESEAGWLAVCDALRVLDTAVSAQADGVRPGMRRATALALSHRVRLVERDAQAERAALTELAICALPFTPTLSLVPGDAHGLRTGLLLEVAPSLRLFRGLASLKAGLQRSLADQGVSVRMASASNPTAAWLLAQSPVVARAPGIPRRPDVARTPGASRTSAGAGTPDVSRTSDGARTPGVSRTSAEARTPDVAQSPVIVEAPAVDPDLFSTTALLDEQTRLRALPIGLLASAHGQAGALEAIGVRTIADFEALPRAGLARRHGVALLTELDRAFGRRPDPRPLFEAPHHFTARLEWLSAVEHAEALLFAGQRLLAQLSAWLAAAHAGTRHCRFTLEHDDGRQVETLELQTSEATRDPQRLSTLLREKLAVHRLVAPVQALRLDCAAPLPLAAPTLDLLTDAGHAPENLGRLIERLRARLGDDQIQRLHLVDDHRPEAAYRLLAETGERPPASPACVGTDLPRPLWLFAEPIALTEHDHRPCWQGPLHLLVGPERIETGWWDGHLIQRDYFIAEDEAHQWYWIYRERQPDPASGRGWFLQGRFG